MRPKLWAGVLALAMLSPVMAAGQEAESGPGPLFDARDAWIASAYLATAALAFPFDEAAAVAVRDSVLQEGEVLQPAAYVFRLLGVPGPLLIGGGMYAAGWLLEEPSVADVGLHMTEAFLLAGAATYVIKFVAGRARPRLDIRDPFNFEFGRGFGPDDGYRSFPSGHTASAFSAAAVLAHEADRLWEVNPWLVGIATYGLAGLVGASRMYHNQHWMSDVVFGAAIGAFSGWKVVRYNHDNRQTKIDDWLLSFHVVPGDLSTMRVGLLPVSAMR